MIRIITAVLLAVIILSCEKKEKQQDMPAPTDSMKTAVDSLKAEYNEKAPEWFNHIPEVQGYIYAVAEGISIRANIAEQKALLKARAKLAEKAEEAAQESDGASSGPGVDGEAEKDARSIILERSIVKRTLFISYFIHCFKII